MIVLGEKVSDSVTGFSGVATARTEYLAGHRKVMVERANKEGRPEEVWFDESRLKLADPEPPTGLYT